MTDLLRDEIKYVRDINKSAYVKDSKCAISGETEQLEFHHYISQTALWNKWKKDNNIIIKCVDDILEHRIIFKEDHYDAIYNQTVTLTKEWHMKLHKIYGKVPSLATSEKQKRWVEKQRIKYLNKSET